MMLFRSLKQYFEEILHPTTPFNLFTDMKTETPYEMFCNI